MGYPGSCAVFVADGQFVVKLFPPMLRRDFHREREVYRLLEHRLDAIPRLLADGIYHDRIEWPYLILQFCAGEPIRELYQRGIWQGVTAANKEAIGQALGQMIRTVHEIPLTEASHFDERPPAWQQFIIERRSTCLDDLRRETPLPAVVLAEAAAFLDEVLPELLEKAQPCLIHADLTEDHLLLVEQAGEWHISALIDWADAEAGMPAYEWVALWFSLCRQDKSLFRAVLHAYNPALRLDDTLRRWMLAYTLLHRFGAGAIAESLQRAGDPPIYTLADLEQQLLWRK